MTPEQLAAAGFTPEEIQAYNSKGAPAFDLTGPDAQKGVELANAGFSEREIADYFTKNKAQPTSSPVVEKVPTREFTPSEQWLLQSKPGQIAAGAMYGLGNIAKNVEKLGAGLGEKIGLVKPGTADAIKLEQEAMSKQMSPYLSSSSVSRPAYEKGQWQNVDSFVGTPASGGKLVGEILPFLGMPGGVQGNILKRAGTSAIGGAVQGALTNPDPLTGLLSGGIGGGLGAATLGVASKGYNILSNKPVNNQTQKLADYYGIRTTLGEATHNPLVQKMETWLESVPIIGLKKFRESQHAEAENAGKNFISRFIADPTSPDIMVGNRDFVSKLYANLDQKVSGVGGQIIKPTETHRVAVSELNSLSDLFKKFQNTDLEAKINNIVGDTSSKTVTSPILNAKGGTITSTQQPQITFDDMWQLRQGLGEMIGQARKKLASGDVNMTELGKLNGLYSSVNKDIDKWTSSINRQDIREAINAANDAYKQYVVKYDVIERAWAKATGEKGGGEMFSPKKFSTALKTIAYDQKKGKYNTFSPQEIEEVSGLANIMQVVKRSGQYMENPPTGNRWGTLLGLSGLGGGTYMAGGLPAVGAGIGGTMLTRFLTSSPVGKRLVMSASKIEPNSTAMQMVMSRIYNQLPKISAAEMSEGR